MEGFLDYFAIKFYNYSILYNICQKIKNAILGGCYGIQTYVINFTAGKGWIP